MEDLAALAKLGHFSKAAEARFITQSALSRRIKSLEMWAGAELLDRSQHPIRLTPAGHEFMIAGNRIIKTAYEAQAVAANYARIAQSGVTIACLHTLALHYLPGLVASLRQSVGNFESSIVPETRTIDEYLYSLRNGSCDFFVCYTHPGLIFDVDLDEYPRVCVGRDLIAPCATNPALFERFAPTSREDIPYLEYGPTSVMSKVIRRLLAKAPFMDRLRTCYRATLAESLASAATQGLGVAWLPESLATDPNRVRRLHVLPGQYSTELGILVFRSKSNERPIVKRIWNELLERSQT